MTHIAPTAVYFLCLATSVICAVLLFRAWRASRTRLLLWTALSFVLFAINNLLLVIDLVYLPAQVDLSLWRSLTMLAALGVLLYGFVWEVEA
jgi:hypothetical protein